MPSVQSQPKPWAAQPDQTCAGRDALLPAMMKTQSAALLLPSSVKPIREDDIGQWLSLERTNVGTCSECSDMAVAALIRRQYT